MNIGFRCTCICTHSHFKKSYWGKGFKTVSYLFFLVEVSGLPVILAGFPVTADNMAYNVLVEHNNL